MPANNIIRMLPRVKFSSLVVFWKKWRTVLLKSISQLHANRQPTGSWMANRSLGELLFAFNPNLITQLSDQIPLWVLDFTDSFSPVTVYIHEWSANNNTWYMAVEVIVNCLQPFNSWDLTSNSPFWLLYISFTLDKRIWCCIKCSLQGDTFIYSHHLCAGQFNDNILRRSYMPITPGS